MGKMKFGKTESNALSVSTPRKPILGGLTTEQIMSTLDSHKEELKALIPEEKPLTTMLPSPVLETQVVHKTELITKPDHRARKYAKALSLKTDEKLDATIEVVNERFVDVGVKREKMATELVRLANSLEIQQQKIKDLSKELSESKPIKVEEKQVVIEKPVTSKMVLIGLGISLALNVLILIIK